MGRKLLAMAVLGRRKRGRPMRRWLDGARECVIKVVAIEGDEVD